MKKQLRQLFAKQRIDARHPAGRRSRHRRLMFERCEERLALSGSSVVFGEVASSEGGFISLDAGDFISPSTNSFIVSDSSSTLFNLDRSSTPARNGSIRYSDTGLRWYSTFEAITFEPVEISGANTFVLGALVEVETPVQGAGIDFLQNLSTDRDTNTYRAIIDNLSADALPGGLNDSAVAVSGSEVISPPAVVTSEKPSTDTVFNGASQNSVVEAIADPLKIEPGDTFANQFVPPETREEETWEEPFTERQNLWFARAYDFLQPSETTSTEVALDKTISSNTTNSDALTHVDSTVVIVDKSLSTPQEEEELVAPDTSQKSAVVGDHPGGVPEGIVPEDNAHGLPVRSVLSTSEEDGNRIELPSPQDDDAFTYSTEGGPIEVDLAVSETQQAYEAKVFLAVSVQLDEEEILAQPVSPVQQPFSGELARSVAFEMVGLEPTADSTPVNESPLSSTAFPISRVDAEIAASEEAVNDEEADIELSRVLAFAQWPLVYPATVGAVLLGLPRRGQSSDVKLEPRKKR